MRLEAITVFSSSNTFDITEDLSLVFLLETLGVVGHQNLYASILLHAVVSTPLTHEIRF
jgi:hypothetical protein